MIGRRPMCWWMPTGLPALSSMKSDLGQAHQHRLAVAQLVLRLDAAADDLLGRDAVDLLGPRPHELDAPAGDDEGLEAVGAQVGEQFQHRLIDHVGVGPARLGMPRRGEPVLRRSSRTPRSSCRHGRPSRSAQMASRRRRVRSRHRPSAGTRKAPVSCHSGCCGASALTRSRANASWTYTGCSDHSVPSLSNTAMRSAGGTKSGEPSA